MYKIAYVNKLSAIYDNDLMKMILSSSLRDRALLPNTPYTLEYITRHNDEFIRIIEDLIKIKPNCGWDIYYTDFQRYIIYRTDDRELIVTEDDLINVNDR